MLVVSVFGLVAPSPAVRTPPSASVPRTSCARRGTRALAGAPRSYEAPRPLVHRHGELLAFTNAPTPTQSYVGQPDPQRLPRSAWHDAEIVAWCESKFRPTDIGFDSNGTHDRGVFQLNDGGTEQYLLTMLGHNPNDLDLALNPVINVRLAASSTTATAGAPGPARRTSRRRPSARGASGALALGGERRDAGRSRRWMYPVG